VSKDLYGRLVGMEGSGDLAGCSYQTRWLGCLDWETVRLDGGSGSCRLSLAVLALDFHLLGNRHICGVLVY